MNRHTPTASTQTGGTSVPHSGTRAVHLELSLDWLIEQSLLERSRPHRRLNALENLVAYAAQSWRPTALRHVARDIRLSAATYEILYQWVCVVPPLDAATAERLARYREQIDPTVPDGLLRLLLAQ